MKNEFKRFNSGEVHISEWNEIIRLMQDAGEWINSGNANKADVIAYVQQIIDQAEPGIGNGECLYWGFDGAEKFPSDGRCDFFYMPTYIMAAFMVKAFLVMPQDMLALDGFITTLRKGLNGCMSRDFQGHGYDTSTEEQRILRIFQQAGTYMFAKFISGINDEFCRFYLRKADEYKLDRSEEGTWGEYVFVYGSLMKGRYNYELFMADAQFISTAEINGFELYDLGAYPGIKEGGSNGVKGELYLVDTALIPRLDTLEGEGYLYKKRYVDSELCKGVCVKSIAYEYLQEVSLDKLIRYEDQPWTSEE